MYVCMYIYVYMYIYVCIYVYIYIFCLQGKSTHFDQRVLINFGLEVLEHYFGPKKSNKKNGQ